MQRTNAIHFTKRCPHCGMTIPFGIDPDVMARHQEQECLANSLEDNAL